MVTASVGHQFPLHWEYWDFFTYPYILLLINYNYQTIFIFNGLSLSSYTIIVNNMETQNGLNALSYILSTIIIAIIIGTRHILMNYAIIEGLEATAEFQ